METQEARRVWRELTRGDRMLIVALLAVALASLVWRHAWLPPAELVRIEVGGRLWGEYPMEQGRLLRVEGPIGTSIVEIGKEGARVVVAPCPQQLCRRQGWVRRCGDAVVCVPNRLIVSVTGARGGARWDAVTR